MSGKKKKKIAKGWEYSLVVELCPGKCQALNSIPARQPKKKKKKGRKGEADDCISLG